MQSSFVLCSLQFLSAVDGKCIFNRYSDPRHDKNKKINKKRCLEVDHWSPLVVVHKVCPFYWHTPSSLSLNLKLQLIITWATLLGKKFQLNKHFIVSTKLAPVHLKRQRWRSLLISWNLTTTHLSCQQAGKISFGNIQLPSSSTNQKSSIHNLSTLAIQWPVWLTFGSIRCSLAACWYTKGCSDACIQGPCLVHILTEHRKCLWIMRRKIYFLF